MDDGEFNLSNTIGIGLNIGEQMLLPVSNGEEEAQLALHQHQQQLHQHHQQQHHQQQHEHHQHEHHQHEHHQQHLQEHQQVHYDPTIHMEQPPTAEDLNNTTETTTTVTCLDNSIGNFFRENADLEDLNAKLAETNKILEYTPVEKPTELFPSLEEDNSSKTIVEELGSIAAESAINKNVNEENVPEREEVVTEENTQDKDNEDNEDDEEDVDEVEAEAEDVEAEDVEDIEEVEEDDEVEEEIIPDEVIVPGNTQVSKESTKEGSDKEDKSKADEDKEESNDNEEANEDEDSQEPTSSLRSSRRKEEHVDEDQCRVCCTKENLVSIFKKVEEKIVADMLMSLCPTVSIVVKDYLPQYICNTCCDNVVIAINLKNQCETTEKELRKKLSRHKNKIRRPAGYVVIDAPLDSDPPTDEEPANDEEFKVSDIASATPSEDSDSSDFSDSKKRKTRGRKRRKSAVVTPTEGKKSKTKNKSDEQSSDEDENGDPIKNKRKRSSNSSPENFDCDECGQSFSRKQSLVLHKRQHVYDRGEPIKCEVCGKKFKIKGAYRTHLEKHKEERRANKCAQCSRRFNSSSDLKRHIADHHRERQILPSCSKCNRTFTSTSRLQRHKQNGCAAIDPSKTKKSESNSFVVGTDLFKAVAPLQSTYWSDSFSD